MFLERVLVYFQENEKCYKIATKKGDLLDHLL